MKRLSCAAVAFALWLLVPGGAFAQVPTFVEAFEGPQATEPQEAVQAALAGDDRVAVVPYRGDARLLIAGTVSGPRARRSLALRATTTQGDELATQTVRLGRGSAARIRDAAGELLTAALPHVPPPPAPEPEPEVERTPVADEPAEEREPLPGEVPTIASTRADPALVSIYLGVTVRNRNATIQLAAGSPRIYESGAYVEGVARAEARPLATDAGLARGLSIRLEYAHAIGLGTRDESTNTDVSTTFFRVLGDVGYLFPLGDVVELGAHVGFGFDAYQLGANMVLPGVELPFLRPAVRGRFRLAGELFVVDAEGGFRLPFGREAFASTFGTSGDVFGADVVLGLTGLLDFGLTWRAEFAWTNYWHSFAGAATSAARDGTDGGMRGAVLVGYAFR